MVLLGVRCSLRRSVQRVWELRPDARVRLRVAGKIGCCNAAGGGRAVAKMAAPLGKSAGNRRRERLIREEIIGHRMDARAGSVLGVVGRGSRGGTLAMFHQPAREHRAGVFVEPLVEQGADLLAEIDGVAKAGEFVGLQSGA
jgi:hypothetical protein